MPSLDDRLITCFSSVFPGLSAEQIMDLDGQTYGSWDSLSTVTIAAVVQEEFGVEIDSGQLPDMTSFEAFRSYLQAIG